MSTQPELDRMAKALTRELGKKGLKLKPLQALALVTRMMGDSSIATKQSRTRKPQPSAVGLAFEHAVSMVFQSTGRYGMAVEALFDELDAAFALGEPEDVDRAVRHIFEAPGAPKLQPHIEAQYRLDGLHSLFDRFVMDSLRLVDRTLFEAKMLTASSPEVLFQGPLSDWREQETFDEKSAKNTVGATFEGRLTQNGPQFSFTIAIPHGTESDLEGTDQLALLVEIHEGRPCVRIAHEIYGEPSLTVFGTKTGVQARFEIEPFAPESSDDFAMQANTDVVLSLKGA